MQDSCILDWELYQKVMAKKNKTTIKICTGVGLNMFFPEYITVEIEKPIEKEYKNKNKMGIYRKKPVEIEAIQWVSDNIEQVYEMLGDTLIINTDEDEVKHFINTLEGKMELSWNDYIIRGVKGEFYPCKPDIFDLTYEIVE